MDSDKNRFDLHVARLEGAEPQRPGGSEGEISGEMRWWGWPRAGVKPLDAHLLLTSPPHVRGRRLDLTPRTHTMHESSGELRATSTVFGSVFDSLANTSSKTTLSQPLCY